MVDADENLITNKQTKTNKFIQWMATGDGYMLPDSFGM